MTIVRSIRSVETFVSDELAVRRSSYRPVRDWKSIAFNWATAAIVVTFVALAEGVFIACR